MSLSANDVTAQITSRPSFKSMNMAEIGDKIYKTTNGWQSPGNVTLVHDDERVMMEDYFFIVRRCMQPDFFVVE
jgi:hypothetical protein